MNTGVVVTVVGSAFTAIATIIIGWFVRRTDRAAKLTQQYMDDAAFNMGLVGTLRDDYWALADWAHDTRSKWHRLIAGLPLACEGDGQKMRELLTDIGDLQELPRPKHRDFEREHGRRRSDKDDET